MHGKNDILCCVMDYDLILTNRVLTPTRKTVVPNNNIIQVSKLTE